MSRKIRNMIGTAMISLVALTACGSGEEASVDTNGKDEAITIKVGHISPPDHSFSLGFDEFAEAVEEETNGQVQFEVFGNGQLGGEKDLTEQVQLGTLDMTLVTTSPVANFVPSIGVLDMPFLFEDLDHVYSTLDGEIGEDLLAEVSSVGLKGLAFWENGVRHISNNQTEIRTPEDMKGLKMRTLENDIFVDTYQALGSDSTPIAFPEVYTSFQQGVADGSDFSVGVFQSTKQYEVQPYFSEVGIYYAGAILLMNEATFNSLPEDVQEVIERLGKEYAGVQRQITQEMEAEQMIDIVEHGVQVTEASEIDLVAFKEAVQPVYDKYSERFGDYIERIQATR